jgi:hypothetical protein
MQCVVLSGTGKLVAFRAGCEGPRVGRVIGRSFPENIRNGCRAHLVLFFIFTLLFSMVLRPPAHITLRSVCVWGLCPRVGEENNLSRRSGG